MGNLLEWTEVDVDEADDMLTEWLADRGLDVWALVETCEHGHIGCSHRQGGRCMNELHIEFLHTIARESRVAVGG